MGPRAAAARSSSRGECSPCSPCCCRVSSSIPPYRCWRLEMKLREIAHSRTGDKGNTSNISVIAYDASHYEHLVRHVTDERVKAHFAGIVHGDVRRYELPKIGALNF